MWLSRLQLLTPNLYLVTSNYSQFFPVCTAAAVLTALNLADDLMRAQDEVNRLRRELALLREKR